GQVPEPVPARLPRTARLGRVGRRRKRVRRVRLQPQPERPAAALRQGPAGLPDRRARRQGQLVHRLIGRLGQAVHARGGHVRPARAVHARTPLRARGPAADLPDDPHPRPRQRTTHLLTRNPPPRTLPPPTPPRGLPNPPPLSAADQATITDTYR